MAAPPNVFVLTSDALPASALSLRRLSGRERLSGLFELVAEVRARDDASLVEASMSELLKEPVHVGREQEEPLLHGVLREIELLPPVANELLVYRFTVVPRLWYATQTRRSRIFQDLTVPEIAVAVLSSLGFGDVDHELRLRGDYASHEYTVQYEETDFAFFSRLLEREGIFYWFEHGTGRDRLVMADSNETARRSEGHAAVGYLQGAPSQGTSVTSLGRRHRYVPATVALADYNWRTPGTQLLEESPVAGGNAGVVGGGEENFRDEAAGRRLARLRAEELAARRRIFEGSSTLPTLRPGDVLGVEGHRVETMNRDYLITELVHEVAQLGQSEGGAGDNVAYSNQLVAIELTVPYRPERATPRPRVDGCTYATVDGPELHAVAPIDELGRYKVILPFDTSLTGTGRATRWIRMAQPLTGPSYGMHFPLRVGAEVILTYVHGDVDRPIITGAVPNAVTPSPVVQRNATQSVIQTSSGIRMEFDDNVSR